MEALELKPGDNIDIHLVHERGFAVSRSHAREYTGTAAATGATAAPAYKLARVATNSRQNCAPWVVAKLMRISVLGSRRAWNRAPGASK